LYACMHLVLDEKFLMVRNDVLPIFPSPQNLAPCLTHIIHMYSYIVDDI
jgi:hypothetical protein